MLCIDRILCILIILGINDGSNAIVNYVLFIYNYI
jgi:hypothetical protein